MAGRCGRRVAPVAPRPLAFPSLRSLNSENFPAGSKASVAKTAIRRGAGQRCKKSTVVTEFARERLGPRVPQPQFGMPVTHGLCRGQYQLKGAALAPPMRLFAWLSSVPVLATLDNASTAKSLPYHDDALCREKIFAIVRERKTAGSPELPLGEIRRGVRDSLVTLREGCWTPAL